MKRNCENIQSLGSIDPQRKMQLKEIKRRFSSRVIVRKTKGLTYKFTEDKNSQMDINKENEFY